jgi:CheY-like chemotaxis protein
VPHPRYIRILSISDDGMVRSTRELVLRHDGYEIVSIGSGELLSVPEIRSFDVAVICYTVPPVRAIAIVDRLRRYKPEIRVLRVNPRARRVDCLYQADTEVFAGPGALLRGVKELLEINSGDAAVLGPQGRDECRGPFPAVPWSSTVVQRT